MVSDLYENLLKATDNTADITNEKYGTVTKINNGLVSVKEDAADIEHSNVPILNNVIVELGDRVVLGFVNNSIYNPVLLGTLEKHTVENDVDWSDIENKPSTFPPSVHNHNDLYYTNTEIDNQLLLKQDVIEDTGWKDLSLDSNFTHYTETEQRAKYRRIGKTVYVRGAVKNTNAFTPSDEGTTVATINDTTCRPQYFYVFTQQGSGMNRFMLRINADGTIAIGRYGTTSASQVGAGSWLNLHCSFVVE